MKQIDIRDFTNYHYPTIFTPAPDGKHAVMAVVDASEKDNCYEYCLWLYDMETKKTSRLTSGKKERTFIWMDSETVLFIADREKTYQEKAKNEEDWTCFYTLNIHGGEAQFAFAVPYKAVKMKKAGNKLVLTVKYDYNNPVSQSRRNHSPDRKPPVSFSSCFRFPDRSPRTEARRIPRSPSLPSRP